MKNPKAPADCRSVDAVCELQTDHHDHKDLWILTDGYRVSIRRQKAGREPTEGIQMTPAEFNQLVRWWQRPQKLTSRTSNSKQGE